MTFAMDYPPSQIMRMVQLGQEDELLASKTIWVCLSCNTCSIRCPNDIDISAVMDALRQLAVTEGYPAGERDALLFHKLFLGVVQRLGRSHEAAVLGLFKLLSRVPKYRDMDSGIALIRRGKVPILPKKSGAAPEVQQIFRRSK